MKMTMTWQPLASARCVPGSAHSITTNTLKEGPECLYRCIRAGSPLACTVLNDIMTLGCHCWRSVETAKFANCNLASASERAFMQDRYSPNVMSQGPIVNFIVWRRSVLLMFFSASLGAFIFFLIGDVWTTFGHMRDMQQFATWNASYSQWKNQTTTGLQEIHCQERHSLRIGSEIVCPNTCGACPQLCRDERQRHEMRRSGR